MAIGVVYMRSSFCDKD